MKNNLQLTEDQEKSAQEINLKYANKTEELRNNDEGRTQKFKKLKGYNDAKDDELKKVTYGRTIQDVPSKKGRGEGRI